MLRNNLSFIIIMGMLAVSSSCTKTGSTGPAGPTGPTGPAGPSYTGAISGHVSLYDQYGSIVLTGRNNAQLKINGGTAINADATGYYIFGGLATGDYNIATTASGYAATQTNDFQFLADTLNKDIKLSAIPDFSPTAINAYTAAGAPGDSIVINFTADTRARNCILFVNTNTTVGNLPANYMLVYTKAIAANATKAVILIPSADLSDAGITSGTTIYCAAYGYVVGDVSVYEDQSTGRNVYNAVSISPVTTTTTAP